MVTWDAVVRAWPGRMLVVDRRLRIVSASAEWQPILAQLSTVELSEGITLNRFLRQALPADENLFQRITDGISNVVAGRSSGWQTCYVYPGPDHPTLRHWVAVPWPPAGLGTVAVTESEITHTLAHLGFFWEECFATERPRRGTEVFQRIVRSLTRWSGARWGYMCQWLGTRPPRAKTVVLWDGTRFHEPIEFPLAQTPCEQVYGQGEVLIANGAAQAWPGDTWLVQHNVSAFLGVQLRSPSGRVVGHYGLMHDQPLPQAAEWMAVLRALAPMVALELQTVQIASFPDLLLESPQDILDHLEEAIWIATADMNQWMYANQTAVMLFGLPHAVLCQSPHRILRNIHPDDQERVATVWKSGQPILQPIEFRYRHPDQSQRWIRSHIRIIHRTSEAPWVIGIARDITEEKLVSEAAFENLTKLRSLMHAAPDGIVIIDEQGKIENVNPAVEMMFGYEAGELIGQSAGMLAAPPHNSLHDSYVRRYLDTGQARIIGIGRDEVGVRRDGTQFPIRLAVGEAITGKRRGFIGILHDLSEAKRYEQELIAARKAADEANQAKSRFLATMSHELRTPVNGILGMCTLLAASELNDHQRLLVNNSLSCCRMLLQLINNILDLSKIEAGKLTLDARPERLDEVVDDVCTMFQTAAAERGLELHSLIDPEARVTAVCDANRLRQILVNLVGNAIKFTPQGHVAVRLQAFPVGEDAISFRIEVEDTGIGIAPDQIDRIFQPYIQADTRIASKYGGTGLGLFLCKQLVELMGGQIGVQSTPGIGSTFWVQLTFPRSQEEVSPRYSAAHLSELLDNKLPGCPRILVAEDNPVNQLYMAELLRRLGAEVRVVGNGQQAVVVAGEQPFDLVFMDIQMPEMDGLNAARKIRENEKYPPARPPVPIIALTAHATPEDAQDALQAGMNDFITKPVSPDDLVRIIRRYCRCSAPSACNGESDS